MEQTSTQIWQHVRSGERYVVEVDFSGTVIGAAGPLYHMDIAAARHGDYTSDTDLVLDIDGTQDDYRLIEPQERIRTL